MLSDGKYGIIVSVKIEELETPETTYNFEVEDFHTYQGKIAMQIARCDYAVEMLNAFIKSDEKIDELEGGVLPLGYNPMPDISHRLMVDLKMLISYCL